MGYAVHPAAHGAAGLEVLDGLSRMGMSVSLVVVDRQMPVMGGLDMIERIRQRDDGWMTIVLTSGSRGPTTGADVVLSKPFTAVQLVSAVRGEHPFS